MEDLTRAILKNKNLDDKDKLLLLYIYMIQSENRCAKRVELGSLLGCSKVTISKRIRDLRDKGLISQRRINQRDWIYNLSRLVSLDTNPEYQ